MSNHRFIGTITVYAYSEEDNLPDALKDSIDQLKELVGFINTYPEYEVSADLERVHHLHFGSIKSKEYDLSTLKAKEDV